MRISDYLYHYKFRVDRVIDGDTVVGRLDKGRKNYDEDVRIRLIGIDAPEIRGDGKEEGFKSKAYLEGKILGKELIVKTYKNRDDDNFGRMRGELFMPEDGMNINKHMIESGYAVASGKVYA